MFLLNRVVLYNTILLSKLFDAQLKQYLLLVALNKIRLIKSNFFHFVNVFKRYQFELG